ncbi:DUF2249 domain-containing protein [Mycobacterium sp. DSM 3803]|nr:DUF2249 domain-containing protein [Mycobacterium sp. DSM 3803]OKH81086.1 hypothetical protein EB73_31270 [Mycobacterium sp. SWH-M3]
MPDLELDVRALPKPDKHPAVFAAYQSLAVGGAFVLVNDHDPKHLRDEFGVEHPGSYGWEYVESGPRVWRIRISKRASTPLPRVLTNTAAADHGVADVTGAVWKLQMRDRGLDSNIIVLAPETGIDAHAGPDLDVLIHVLDGSGRLTTELGSFELTPGDVVWLPRRSHRQFSAGPHGLRYLTVHRRRQALVVQTAAPQVV